MITHPEIRKFRFLTGAILLLWPASSAWGQAAAAAACSIGREENCTIEEYMKLQVAVRAVGEAGSRVVNTNSATPTPDPFASRVHSQFQDFLNFLSFGISQVEESEDGQSLVVRLNPARKGRHLLGLSLTVTKPQVSEAIVMAVPEGQRSAITDSLASQLSDLDDVTWSVSYSFADKQCNQETAASRGCWGRNGRIYRQLLSSPLIDAGGAALARVTDPLFLDESDIATIVQSDPAFAQESSGGVVDIKLKDLQQENREKLMAAAGMLSSKEEPARQMAVAVYKESGFDNLATLIDNQPQLSFTGAYRDPGEFGGPTETSLSLEFQRGRKNINSVFSSGDPSTNLKKLMTSTMLQDKFVMSASFKHRDDFALAELFTGAPNDDPVPVEGFVPIDLESTNEFRFKLQWGMELNARVGQEKARFDISGEAIWNDFDSDGEMADLMTKNRVVATATFTVPLGQQMSLPISVSYADKPEFLPEEGKRIGVHFGVAYRLPFWQQK